MGEIEDSGGIYNVLIGGICMSSLVVYLVIQGIEFAGEEIRFLLIGVLRKRSRDANGLFFIKGGQ